MTSKAPGSGTSISSSWKASRGSPSRSSRITQADMVSGRVPGSTESSLGLVRSIWAIGPLGAMSSARGERAGGFRLRRGSYAAGRGERPRPAPTPERLGCLRRPRGLRALGPLRRHEPERQDGACDGHAGGQPHAARERVDERFLDAVPTFAASAGSRPSRWPPLPEPRLSTRCSRCAAVTGSPERVSSSRARPGAGRAPRWAATPKVAAHHAAHREDPRGRAGLFGATAFIAAV